MHEFELQPGELIHIGGIPYEHVGNGMLRGGTDPAYARNSRDEGRYPIKGPGADDASSDMPKYAQIGGAPAEKWGG